MANGVGYEFKTRVTSSSDQNYRDFIANDGQTLSSSRLPSQRSEKAEPGGLLQVHSYHSEFQSSLGMKSHLSSKTKTKQKTRKKKINFNNSYTILG